MLKCDVIKPELSAYRDGALPPAERAIIEAHLAACIDCTAELAAIESARASLIALPKLKAPEALAAKIKAQIASEKQNRTSELREVKAGGARNSWIALVSGIAATLVIGLLGYVVFFNTPAGPKVTQLEPTKSKPAENPVTEASPVPAAKLDPEAPDAPFAKDAKPGNIAPFADGKTPAANEPLARPEDALAKRDAVRRAGDPQGIAAPKPGAIGTGAPAPTVAAKRKAEQFGGGSGANKQLPEEKELQEKERDMAKLDAKTRERIEMKAAPAAPADRAAGGELFGAAPRPALAESKKQALDGARPEAAAKKEAGEAVAPPAEKAAAAKDDARFAAPAQKAEANKNFDKNTGAAANGANRAESAKAGVAPDKSPAPSDADALRERVAGLAGAKKLEEELRQSKDSAPDRKAHNDLAIEGAEDPNAARRALTEKRSDAPVAKKSGAASNAPSGGRGNAGADVKRTVVLRTRDLIGLREKIKALAESQNAALKTSDLATFSDKAAKAVEKEALGVPAVYAITVDASRADSVMQQLAALSSAKDTPVLADDKTVANAPVVKVPAAPVKPATAPTPADPAASASAAPAAPVTPAPPIVAPPGATLLPATTPAPAQKVTIWIEITIEQ